MTVPHFCSKVTQSPSMLALSLSLFGHLLTLSHLSPSLSMFVTSLTFLFYLISMALPPFCSKIAPVTFNARSVTFPFWSPLDSITPLAITSHVCYVTYISLLSDINGSAPFSLKGSPSHLQCLLCHFPFSLTSRLYHTSRHHLPCL